MSTSSNATVPSILELNGNQFYYVPYQFASIIGPEKWWRDSDKGPIFAFARDHWHYSIWVAIFYSLAVHIGQRAMVSRKAWEMRNSLIIWNAILAVFSLCGAIRMGEDVMNVWTTRPLLDSIIYTVDPHQPAAFWGLCFAISKVIELGDTVFVVLRKKPLIFLHWYHHAAVLVYVMHAATELTGVFRVLGLINYSVHSMMYAYYSISAAGFRFPRPISMLITTLQTVQMFVGVAFTFIVTYHKVHGKVVQQSYENIAICCTIYVSFAILFMQYFHKSYLADKKTKAKAE